MDEFEIKTAATAATSDLSELQGRVESLRQLVLSLLVLLIVVSGTLNLFLLRQLRYTRTDLAAIRPNATRMIAEYQKSGAPAMDNLIKQVTDYGKTHPDFAPIMQKYGLDKLPPPAASPPAAAAPLPGSPVKPKK